MPILLLLETDWKTGQTVNVDIKEEVDNLTQAKNILEADFAKNASPEFARMVIDMLDSGINHIHVRNGRADSGFRIMYIP